MKRIVIEVTDALYKSLMLGYEDPYIKAFGDCVRSGTLLPKGHGDLVTKEQMIELVEFYQMNPQHFDFVNLIDEIKDEKPIIESDKEGEKEEKCVTQRIR